VICILDSVFTVIYIYSCLFWSLHFSRKFVKLIVSIVIRMFWNRACKFDRGCAHFIIIFVSDLGIANRASLVLLLSLAFSWNLSWLSHVSIGEITFCLIAEGLCLLISPEIAYFYPTEIPYTGRKKLYRKKMGGGDFYGPFDGHTLSGAYKGFPQTGRTSVAP